MWDAIKEILTSSNAVGVLLILGFIVVVLIIVAVVLIKGNYFQLRTQTVQIGFAEKERNIIRQQQDYVWQHLQEAEANLPKDETYDEQLGLIIIQTVYIEYTKWIAFNHLTRSEAYIHVKQNSLVAIVNRLTVNQRYKGEDFIQYIKDDTKDTILELLKIREAFK